MPVLTAEHVSFAYRPGQWVVQDVSLHLTSPTLCALVGPNGAGKSTLLGLLSAWHVPVQGRVLLDGVPVHSLPAPARAARVALVPSSLAVPLDLPVEALVSLGRLHRQHSPFAALAPADRAAVAAALAATRTAAFRHRTYGSLSTGEQARVALAVALAQDPAVLLLDEPVAHLDPGAQHAILSLLASWRDQGRIVVLAVHDLLLAGMYADTVLLLSRGRVAAQGPPDAVLRPDLLEPVYGIPFLQVAHPTRGRPLVLPDPPEPPVAEAGQGW